MVLLQGAEKQYYVSKRCSTEEECDKEIMANMPLCHYIWYEDWKCAECCQGDRCNYYVTVSTSKMSKNGAKSKFQILLFSWAHQM